MKRRWTLTHIYTPTGNSCHAAGAPKVCTPAFPGATFSFAQTIVGQLLWYPGPHAEAREQGLLQGAALSKISQSPHQHIAATSSNVQLWAWGLCPPQSLIPEKTGIPLFWAMQGHGVQALSSKRQGAVTLTLGWSCSTTSTVKQTLTPECVTAEGTFLKRMLDTPALPSGSSPSASPGISISGSWCTHSSWGSWFQPQRSLCCKEQRKKPEFAFWTCCTGMIRKLAGPQGWQTSLPPPPRLPSDLILLNPKAVAEERAAGDSGIFAPTGPPLTSCLVCELCLLWRLCRGQRTIDYRTAILAPLSHQSQRALSSSANAWLDHRLQKDLQVQPATPRQTHPHGSIMSVSGSFPELIVLTLNNFFLTLPWQWPGFTSSLWFPFSFLCWREELC